MRMTPAASGSDATHPSAELLPVLKLSSTSPRSSASKNRSGGSSTGRTVIHRETPRPPYRRLMWFLMLNGSSSGLSRPLVWRPSQGAPSLHERSCPRHATDRPADDLLRVVPHGSGAPLFRDLARSFFLDYGHQGAYSVPEIPNLCPSSDLRSPADRGVMEVFLTGP